MNVYMFSVIIPVYNVEKYLSKCIDSILSQTFTNYEIILIDDGSTDGSHSICERYKKKYNGKIKLITKKNGGLSSARNCGINHASGEYIVFVDSDDYWCDDTALKDISKIINISSPDVIVFPFKKSYPDGNFKLAYSRDLCSKFNSNSCINKLKKDLIESNLYRACAWNKIVKHNIIKEHKMCFLDGVLSEDMDWCGNLLIYSNRIVFYNNPLYVYRQARKGSITSGKNSKLIDDKIYMCKKGYEQALELEESNKNLLMSYYAYEYCVLIGVSAGANNNQLYKMRELKPILRFDMNNKVKKVNKVLNIFGFSITRFILSFFVKYK